MKIDLIIPTYCPGSEFAEVLSRISRQSLVPDHIYLMNTEADMFPSELLEPYDNITIVHITKSGFDHGGTRNYGVSLSDADVVVFMTQDALPKNRHLIENLVKPLEDPQVAAVYGRQIADPKDNYLEAYTRRFNYPAQSRKKTKEDLPTLGIKTFFCSNVCSAWRKSDYDQAGGFQRKTIFNEDMILASKLIETGKAVYYAADAIVWHWHNYTSMEQLHRNFDLAVSQTDAGGLFTTVKSEKEGIRFVSETVKHLLKYRHLRYLPKFLSDTVLKFIGYKLGQNYRYFSKKTILKLTMNPSYWDSYDKI